LGCDLDPWQEEVLRVSLLRSGGFWAAFTVAVCAPRQNGKNGILEVRELVGPYLLGEPLVIHSAHLADTSKEGFRRLDQLIEANEWLSRDVKHIWRTNGHESIEFRNGNRVRFRTRTKTGGRGFAKGSPIALDEAMILAQASMGSILPVASAHPDPQLWYTGSAVDQETMEDGLVFARVRHRALTGDHDRLAYFEWSLDYEHPDDIPLSVLDDPEAVAATNPAYGVRIQPEYVRAERRELGDRMFATERLGVGDWPDVSPDAGTVIPLDLWRSLVDMDARTVGPVVFAADVTPSRSYASIGVAGRREDGRFHVDVADRRAGTDWVAERLRELTGKWPTLAVVCDSVGPAASLVPEIKQAGVNVETLTTGDYADGCHRLFDAATRKRLSHAGDPQLDSALKAASQRQVGERWLWDRKAAGDISPLVAVTQALGRLSAQPVAKPMVRRSRR
jgi:hypothetical protein